MTGVNYNTLLGWLRVGLLRATLHPRKRWQRIGFTQKEAERAVVIAKQRARARAILWAGRGKPHDD